MSNLLAPFSLLDELTTCYLPAFDRYIKEGSSVSVLGLLHRNNDVVMIVQPQDVISTGCLWQKLLLPVDVDGLVIGFPEGADPLTLTNSTPCQE